MLATIASRCQPCASTRCPRGADRSAPERGGGRRARARLRAPGARATRAPRARALRSARTAAAGEREAAQARAARAVARGALTRHDARALDSRCWRRAQEAGAQAGERAQERLADELELVPSRERRRHEREAPTPARGAERRARTRTLDLGLRLRELWLRDALVRGEGAAELVHAVDRRAALERDAAGAGARARCGRAVELVGDTRLRLALNVSEELALEALAYRIMDLSR